MVHTLESTPRGANALEHAHHGAGHRTEPRDDRSHRAAHNADPQVPLLGPDATEPVADHDAGGRPHDEAVQRRHTAWSGG